jgi:uncharacterized protein (DUF58 family)
VEAQELFTPQFLQKLKLLQILSKKVNWGTQKGEHTSSQRGRSLEFKDFRNYVSGDDIRYIDWNIFGRLDRLFMKLFVEELELTLNVLVDASLSMSLGEPQKLLYAKKIAACLSYIALSNFDRAGIAALDESVRFYKPPMRGTNLIFQCFDFLKTIAPRGRTHLGKALRDFGKRNKRPGLVVIISDFLQEQDFFEGLNLLHFQKNQLFLIQVLDRKEVEPDLRGDLKLVDVETGEFREISMSERLMEMYRRALVSHCTRISEHCSKRGIGYLQTTTDIPFEEIILKYLRMGRLLA